MTRLPLDPQFASPTPDAHRNWQRLSRRRKFALLADAIDLLLRRREEVLPLLGAGVVSLGCGHRMRRPHPAARPRRVLEEPVLVVVVKKKKDEEAFARARADLVPRFVEVALRPTWERRAKPYAIPTDVSAEHGGLAADGSGGAGRQALVAHEGSGAMDVEGTSCALVTPKGAVSPAYLLGCHHVVRRSLLTSDASPMDPAEFLALGASIGTVGPSADFGQAVPDSFDAALVRLNAIGEALTGKADYWRRTCKTSILSRAELLALGGVTFRLFPSCGLSGHPGAAPVDLELQGCQYRYPITYDGGGRVTIGEVALFEAVGGTTVGGYSGAPVVVLGKLAGMHIAGDWVQNSNGTQSYITAMIPAYQLLAPGVVHTSGLALSPIPGPSTSPC